MQPLAFQAKLFRELGVGAVDEVTAARVMQRGEMHPDLMGAAGFQVHVEQAGGHEGFHGVVVGEAVPAVLGHRELPLAAAVTSDRRVDGPAGRIRMSLHQRVIALVDGALFERPLEQGVGALGQRHHHHPGRADVEAVHNALPLGHTRGGDPVTGGGQATEHRGSGPAHRRVRGHRRRLVDRDDVVVGVQDRHALDVDRRVLQRRGRLGQAHLQPGAAGQPVGLAGPDAVEFDAAVFGQGRRRAARQPQQPCQPGVDTHARQSLRDGHRAVTHPRCPGRRLRCRRAGRPRCADQPSRSRTRRWTAPPAGWRRRPPRDRRR